MCLRSLPVLYSLDSLVCGHSPAQTCGRTGILSFMSFTVLLLSVFASVFQHFIVLTDVLCIWVQFCISSKNFVCVHSRNDSLRKTRCLACTFHAYLALTAALSRYWFSYFTDGEQAQ